jgi:hypothetical protein
MVDAIQKQLPSRNKVNLALDRWTSMNQLVIMLAIAYNMDHTLALQEVSLSFNDVDSLFCSFIEP